MTRKFPILLTLVIGIGLAAWVLTRSEQPPVSGDNPSNLKPEQPPAIAAEKKAAKPAPQRAARSLSLAQPGDNSWWANAVIYQIWPRSFYDADGDGNGDFVGLTKKLDYLKTLGVDAIWLTPIFDSPSYHGYDTADYYHLEPAYGTMAEFEAFIAKAKQMHIKIILDLVTNDVAKTHPWFLQALNNDPLYRDYFVWRDTLPTDYGKAWGTEVDPESVWHKPDGHDGYYYGVFGSPQPDLNFNNPKVVEEIKNVARFWLNKGIDGFRLDAIRYIVEDGGVEGQADTQGTIDFWADFSAYVKAINPNALLVGEALTETDKIGAYYNNGKGIDGAFDFGFNYLLQSILEKRDADQAPAIDRKQMMKSIRNNLWDAFNRRNRNADVPGYFYHTFLNNHDHDRLNTFFGGDVQRAKIAASLLLMSPGTAYIYYGEEVGMSQYATGDDMYRRALMQWDGSDNAGFNTTGQRWLDKGEWFFWNSGFTPWWHDYWQYPGNKTVFNVAAQQRDKDSLLNFYTRLIALRKSDPVLHNPDTMHLYDETDMAWVVEYRRGDARRWVVLNLDPDNSTAFALPGELRGEFSELVSQQALTLTDELTLEPGQLMVLNPR